MTIKIIKSSDHIAVSAPWHPEFVDRCHVMRARWDADNQAWIFPAAIIDDVRDVLLGIYGQDDRPTPTATVTIDVTMDLYADLTAVTLLGRVLSRARGNRSKALAGVDVVYLSGAPESGGSTKNWESRVPKGSRIKLLNVPTRLLDDAKLPEGCIIVNIVNNMSELEMLQNKRNALLAELEQLDAQISMITA